MDNVYPSTKELLNEDALAILPASLAAEIRERYESLGSKYLTELQTTDGRHINAMMQTSRIDNCLEEIVDAAFCILGWRFKCQEYEYDFPDEAGQVLQLLIHAYTVLKLEQIHGTYS